MTSFALLFVRPFSTRTSCLNDEVLSKYNYNLCTTQGGRLYQLQSGLSSNTTSLQNLFYTYYAAGNVLTIKDFKAGSPQTQTFTYDPLDRLISAQATGGLAGNGNYGPESYTYNSNTGNLQSRTQGGDTITYDYSDPLHARAVTTAGSNTYCYNIAGNMTRRPWRAGGQRLRRACWNGPGAGQFCSAPVWQFDQVTWLWIGRVACQPQNLNNLIVQRMMGVRHSHQSDTL
jgi:YD repeat-containing protein